MANETEHGGQLRSSVESNRHRIEHEEKMLIVCVYMEVFGIIMTAASGVWFMQTRGFGSIVLIVASASILCYSKCASENLLRGDNTHVR